MPLWPHLLAGFAGFALIAVVLRDAFETMVLPRRLNGRVRFTSIYFRSLWLLWTRAAAVFGDRRARESWLSIFGPLSMLLLFVLWGASLIVGFAALYWTFGVHFTPDMPPPFFRADLYLSGDTLVTLGSVTAAGGWGRLLVICEGGLGLGFVAVIISYLPVLYSGFSNRERNISMLDARAGSPPSASELIRRHATDLNGLALYLAEWERWSAELLESHISFPVLGYFRSQHVNQSWLAALTAILDASALLMAASERRCSCQAQLTFAIARHAVVDLAQIYIRGLPASIPERLPPPQAAELRRVAALANLSLGAEEFTALLELRRLYEPHIVGISRRLRFDIPPWAGNPDALDNWQRSPWDRTPTRILRRADPPVADRHF